MAYAFTNSKGVTYYLHTRRTPAASGKERVLFFFSKEIKEGVMDAVPDGLHRRRNEDRPARPQEESINPNPRHLSSTGNYQPDSCST